MRLPLTLAAGLLAAASAAAHPVPMTQIDRKVEVRPGPGALRVEYRFEIDSTILYWAVNQMDVGELEALSDYRAAFAERAGAILADQMLAELDGHPLTFRVERQDTEVLPDEHTACAYTFVADWSPAPGRHRLEFEEITRLAEVKPGLRPGAAALTLAELPGVAVLSRELPPGGLRAKSPAELSEAEDASLRRLSFTFEVTGPAGREARPAPAEAAKPAAADGGSLWRRVREGGLSALLDSGYGVGLLLLVAAVFGSAHALTPGHGKTMVAAYLVGERGTPLHAVLLGVVTTLTHTGTVILVAFVLWRVYPDTVPADAQAVLGFVGGLVIAGLGVWLLMRRVGGQADHVHLFGSGHHHHHGHDHHHDHELPAGTGWGRLILLGVAGGIVPCWDAVALLGIAITANRLYLAVPLLLAFSAGLAAVLVALGLAVVYAKRLGAGKFRERGWFKALPVVSAALLIGIGLWLCRDSLRLAG